MPLLINREQIVLQGHSIPGSVQPGSLRRIVSGMKVSSAQEDSVGLDRFMQDVSALFAQDQGRAFGVEGSTR